MIIKYLRSELVQTFTYVHTLIYLVLNWLKPWCLILYFYFSDSCPSLDEIHPEFNLLLFNDLNNLTSTFKNSFGLLTSIAWVLMLCILWILNSNASKGLLAEFLTFIDDKKFFILDGILMLDYNLKTSSKSTSHPTIK